MVQMRCFLVIIYSFFFSTTLSPLLANENKIEPKISDSYDPVPMVMNHISDSYDWHFFDYKDKSGNTHPVSIPLPIILYTNGNFDIFLSSKFEHGHKSVQINERTYALESGRIKELHGYHFLDFSITKNVTAMIFSAFLLVFIFSVSANSYKNNNRSPSGIQAFLEPLILFVRDEIIIKNIGAKHFKYLPFLLTVFFFILINNILGLLPASANVTGNIAVTLVLSFITFIITTFSGNKNYWGHIFRPPGVPVILLPIMIPIEFLGIFTKPFALMIRLFANISAGHIIILSLISLIFIAQDSLGDIGAWSVAPVSVVFVLFISLIEILVAFLQAYIFTLLSAVFIGMAVVEEH